MNLSTSRRPDFDDEYLADAIRPPSLEEATEALFYWRARLGRLPRRQFARRREAREMVWRWEERLRSAELRRWGASPLGRTLASLMVLRGLTPSQIATRACRRFAPLRIAVAAVAATIAAVAVFTCVAAVELLHVLF